MLYFPPQIKEKEIAKKSETKIEIKMALHKPRKSTPQQDSSDEKMIEYDLSVCLIPYNLSESVLGEDHWKYSHELTPTHYRNGRD
ncbi:hypothetical protein TNCV_1856831 [Trichonephila clavipes]|nr:hypothetical protein TNCV_1856831 [Trichonephila clavipes]